MGNIETFEVMSSTFQILKSHERKLEQILNFIRVFFLELVVFWMLLFFSHWPSYSNCWNQTSNISIFVMQTEEVVQQGSINREEGQDSGRGSTEEGEATRRPAAGGHTEAQQRTVWQWSTQTQSMFRYCIIVMTHSPTAKVLHSCNGTYIPGCW